MDISGPFVRVNKSKIDDSKIEIDLVSDTDSDARSDEPPSDEPPSDENIDDNDIFIKRIDKDGNYEEDRTWQELGIRMEKWLIENKPDDNTPNRDYLWSAYNNLINGTNVYSKYQGSEYYPYKNGIHYLLHLWTRSAKFTTSATRECLKIFIIMIWSFKDLFHEYDEYGNITEHTKNGLYRHDIDLDDILPKNYNIIEKYNNIIPQFKFNKHELICHVKQQKTDIKNKKKKKTYINRNLYDNVVIRPLDYKDNDDDDDDDGDDDDDDDDNDNKREEKHSYTKFKKMFQYDYKVYGNYIRELRTFRYFSLHQYILWFMLTPNFRKSIDTSFAKHTDRQRSPEISIRRFNETNFVKHHILYNSGDYIAELDNGESFWLNDIITLTKLNVDNVFYYIKRIHYGLKNILQDCLHLSQKDIKEKPRLWLHHFCEITVDVIRRCSINGVYEWCIMDTMVIPVFATSTFYKSKLKHYKVSYKFNAGKFEKCRIYRAKHQHDWVRKNKLFLFMQLSYDGVAMTFKDESFNNLILYISNSRYGKTNKNIMRYSMTHKSLDMKYVVSTFCEELTHFREGHKIWAYNIENDGFIRQSIFADISFFIGDNQAKNYQQLTPQNSRFANSDGRLSIHAHQTGIRYPEHTNIDDDSLRTFRWQLHPKHKNDLHTFAHILVKTRQWKSAGSKASAFFGVSNFPWKYYRTLDGIKFEWNFLIGSIGDALHTMTNGPMKILIEDILIQTQYESMEETYQALAQDIIIKNNCLNVTEKTLFSCDKINKTDQMNKMFVKWFFVSSCLPILINWECDVAVLVQLIRLVNEILLCDSEKQRKSLHNSAKKLFKSLGLRLLRLLNTPKWRLMKEIIDFDLFYYASVAIMEGIYIERGHQFPKKISKNRSNHKQSLDCVNIYLYLQRWIGIRYAMNGGHWGPDLRECFTTRCRNMRHPLNKDQLHPLCAEFIDFSQYNIDFLTLNRSKNIIIDQKNCFPRILFETIRDEKKKGGEEKKKEDHIVVDLEDIDNQMIASFLEFIKDRYPRQVFQILSRNSPRFDSLSNLESQINVLPVHTIYINDKRKSNIIRFKNNATNSWFKINYTINNKSKTNNDLRILNAFNIFRIHFLESDLYIYLCFGDIYKFYQQETHVVDSFVDKDNDHYDFMDSFDTATNLSINHWCILNCYTLLESVVITHKHNIFCKGGYRGPRDTQHKKNNKGGNNFYRTFSFQYDWIQKHKEYYIQIKKIKKLNNMTNSMSYMNTLSTIPCGPIRVCIKHQDLLCLRCPRRDNVLETKWFCNTLKNKSYVIWDSRHSFLPGIWKNIYVQYLLGRATKKKNL